MQVKYWVSKHGEISSFFEKFGRFKSFEGWKVGGNVCVFLKPQPLQADTQRTAQSFREGTQIIIF